MEKPHEYQGKVSQMAIREPHTKGLKVDREETNGERQ
jgi:hypothetical protein